MKTLLNFFKNNKTAFIIFAILLIALASISMPFIYRYYEKGLFDDAKRSAEILASAINRHSLLALEYDETDLNNQDYLTIKEALINTKNASDRIKAAYILIEIDGITVAIDSQPLGLSPYSATERAFSLSDGEFADDLKKGMTVAQHIEKDGEETRVAIMTPIFDNDGVLRAAYRNDYYSTEWRRDAINKTWLGGAPILLGYAALMAFIIVAILNNRLNGEKNRLTTANAEISGYREALEKKINEAENSEQRLCRIFYSIPTMMVMCSTRGEIFQANEAFLKVFGFVESEILGKTLKELDVFADESFCDDCIKKGAIDTGFDNKETVLKKRNGEFLDVLISVSRISIGGRTEYVFSLSDITQQKLTEEEIRRLIKKYRTIVAVSNTGGWEYDINNGTFYLSSEYYSMLGKLMGDEGFIGEFISEEDWKQMLHPDDSDEATKCFYGYIAKNTDSLYENYFRLQHADGHWVWILSRGRRLRKDDGGLSNIIVGTHIDITELKDREERIRYLNYYDQLTGVYNRRYYEEILEGITEAQNLPLAIIMADVNGLKMTNDAFGHLSGDKLLTRVAEIIKSEARPLDIVARIGGDEFIMLMPRSVSTDAEKVVKRINDSIQDYKVDNLVVSVSFGWATKKDDEEDFTEVYKRAEYRMYRNKLSERSSKRSQSIRMIFKTLQEKSEQEKLHSERTSFLSRKIAEEMHLSLNEINDIETAGLMHDIGKIGVDEQVLNKTEKFNEGDWRAIKRHSEIGYRYSAPQTNFSVIADYVLYHHERWDGKGYPRGLKENNIPLASRILAVADSYDAMISVRCYKKTKTKKEAATEILRNAGTQFDPDIAMIFVENVLKMNASELLSDDAAGSTE